MNERGCPTCRRFKSIESFRMFAGGKPHRDCIQCEQEKRVRANERLRVVEDRRFAGVDIDAIHYKLGAVKRRVA